MNTDSLPVVISTSLFGTRKTLTLSQSIGGIIGIKIALNHLTRYTYDRKIELGPQVIRLRPAPHARTPIQAYSLKIQPEQHFTSWQQDPFGNYMARAVFPEKTQTFSVEVDLVADIRVFNPFDFFLEENAESYPFAYEAVLAEELAPYLVIKETGSKLKSFVSSISKEKMPLIDFIVGINQKLNSDLKYLVRLEPGVQTCEETLQLSQGSCRDMAWLFCQILRHLGLATRFASGYLIQLKADTKSLDGPSGADHDFTDLHAWTEVYLPGAGWIGLDPTSGLFAGEGHIPLCCTPNPSSAAPITGTLEECKATLEHTMSVVRIEEERRITKPYSDQEWDEINQLGLKVDIDLKKRDTRLTMGGEPTFISLDNKEDPEWQVEALGPDKWKLAHVLLKSLETAFAPGGLIHHGQGKWYPGESLPRWSLGCFWRKDGIPIWAEQQLLAYTTEPNEKLSKGNSNAFITELACVLGIDSGLILPAYEDIALSLVQEGRLPIEGDLLKVNLFEKAERVRLQKMMDAGLNQVVGYVLPLSFSNKRKKWISNGWKFKSEHLFLLSGDSPIGLRLPMNSIPFVEGAADDVWPERSPSEKLGNLPSHSELMKAVSVRYEATSKNKAKAASTDPIGYVRTAVCVEPREGYLNVFLPPISFLEHSLELIAAVEWVAKKLGMPVRIEGYTPPFDLRVQNFKITPDPGVLEVNVQPASSWPEQVEITSTVYEQARLARLVTDRFLLDGRRVGTGGGNHIVLGGATPADSPFLRRPDLLKSMITFWQHHPSLSYLFSSLFIGPTSQSPRIDEARHDSLHELEIAFRKIPEKESVPLWLIDRLLRNLLVDVTGNTHRAEFCIDKLYNPSGETGRLGLLELRNFEMPPHPKMSLVQSLLVRACLSAFWERPYKGALVRWGTRLHDQFMLPHFVWTDLKAALQQLKTEGYEFQSEWFEPLFEFRFPKIGVHQIDNIELELRTALEPWPVLGEESSAGGVSRGVDSSVERLQVKVKGLNESQHVITCNGYRLPLTATDESGVFVAGVRFKAWAPPSSLHPTIGVHAPLVFDVVDTRYGRSVGGCTYHVSHPGGRNYESIPVNENEAAGRCLSRFIPQGHTPGKAKIHVTEINPEFPLTLDLRLQPDL